MADTIHSPHSLGQISAPPPTPYRHLTELHIRPLVTTLYTLEYTTTTAELDTQSHTNKFKFIKTAFNIFQMFACVLLLLLLHYGGPGWNFILTFPRVAQRFLE